MKTFITGATGFLGSHLVDRLLEEKWDVHVLVRRSSNLRWLKDKKIQIHYGDIHKNLEGLREGLKGVDVCFHLAGIILAPRREDYFRVNAEGTRNVLEAVSQVNPHIKRVVVATSLAAQGPGVGDESPNEESECHPVTAYGESKRDAELITLQYAEKFPISIVRPPAIYGPRDSQVLDYFKLANRGVMPLPWNREGRLNLAYVQDVVSGLVLAAEREEAKGETFLIGDKKNYSWDEVVDTIEKVTGKKEIIRFRVPKAVAYAVGVVGDLWAQITKKANPAIMANMINFLQSNWTLDISKAQKLLGYEPEYSLKKGIAETMKWYQENGWL
jgi:dihydroflavonol-4-reductase